MLCYFILASLLVISECLVSGPGIYQLNPPIDHAECPTWDTRNNVLYWINIHEGEVYRHDFLQNVTTKIRLDGEIAPVIPSKDDPNLLFVGLNRSVVAVEWDGESLTPTSVKNYTFFSQQFPTSRVNDGKADKLGRLWLGTMGYEGPEGLTPDEGVFYKITCDNRDSPQPEIAPVNISNGIAFNKANDRMYYIDTPTGFVVEYEFDLETGDLNRPRIVFDVNEHDSITGGPDGMTIDEDDNIWVALYGGGAIVQVNPRTRELLRVIALPALDITSAIWGGVDLDILFVTTSRVSLSEFERQEQPAAGSVFAIVGLGTRGLPMYEVENCDDV